MNTISADLTRGISNYCTEWKWGKTAERSDLEMLQRKWRPNLIETLRNWGIPIFCYTQKGWKTQRIHEILWRQGFFDDVISSSSPCVGKRVLFSPGEYSSSFQKKLYSSKRKKKFVAARVNLLFFLFPLPSYGSNIAGLHLFQKRGLEFHGLGILHDQKFPRPPICVSEGKKSLLGQENNLDGKCDSEDGENILVNSSQNFPPGEKYAAVLKLLIR